MSGDLLEAKAIAFDRWFDVSKEMSIEAIKQDEPSDSPSVTAFCFYEGWDAAMASCSELEAASTELCKFLEAHTAKLSGIEFSLVWYRMQAALAKAGAR